MVNTGVLRLAACVVVIMCVMEYTSAGRRYYGGGGGGGGYTCRNGQTIDSYYVCDGICDCSDSSDESNCGGYGTNINTGIYGFNQRLDAQCRVQLVNSTITKTNTVTTTVVVNSTTTVSSTKICSAIINSTFIASSPLTFTNTVQTITITPVGMNYLAGATTCEVLAAARMAIANEFQPQTVINMVTSSATFTTTCIAVTTCPIH